MKKLLQINSIEGFSNVKDYYYCNEKGEIWSCKGKFKRLQGTHNGTGYLSVSLRTKDGGQRSIYIHKIIAVAYIPNPENKPTVNHKNHIRTDNRVENLEWATRKEQMDNAVKQAMSEAKKGKQGYWQGKPRSEETKRKISETLKKKKNK